MKKSQNYFRTTIVVLLVLVSFTAFSQQGINYQGVARDASDELLISANITLDINIYKTSAAGTLVYNETHATITDVNGVFSIVIGQGVPTAIPYNSINWAEDDHYLNVWLNGTEVGTTQFQATPYTLAIGKWQAQNNGLRPLGTGGSIFLGDNAGANDDLSDNSNNIAIGQDALRDNTTGIGNIAIGTSALQNNTVSYQNIAIGQDALRDNTTGTGNIAIGVFPLKDNTTGSYNTAVGNGSLRSNTTGFRNVAIGGLALIGNTTGDNNTAMGHSALRGNTTGNFNVANGFSALYSNTTGVGNAANGYQALYSNTIGFNNVANGYQALFSNTTGFRNVANGSSALESNTTGSLNTAIGDSALIANTTGGANTAIGFETLERNTTGGSNVAIGSNALQNNTTGQTNTAMGNLALSNNTTGSRNTTIGFSAMTNNGTGSENTAIGNEALRSISLGQWNTAIGNRSLYNNLVGLHNVAIGNDALYENLTGENNIAIGSRAGNNNLGSYNVFLGFSSGYNETGSNKLYISNSSTNFPLIYGEFDNNILGFNANVGIGTQAPVVPLQVRGGTDVTLALNSGQFVLGNHADRNLALDNNEIQARNNGSVSTLYLQGLGGDVNVGGAVVHASDRRLKKDITDLSFGLEEILKLQPKEYNWKGKTQDYKSLGLIAQDVDEVIKNVVTYDARIDRYGVSYTELIPVLIKAIQEQQEIINSLENRNSTQGKMISELDIRLKELEVLVSKNNSN